MRGSDRAKRFGFKLLFKGGTEKKGRGSNGGTTSNKQSTREKHRGLTSHGLGTRQIKRGNTGRFAGKREKKSAEEKKKRRPNGTTRSRTVASADGNKGGRRHSERGKLEETKKATVAHRT